MKQKFIIYIFILGLFLPLYHVGAFTILSTNNYAWSNNVGWINFAPVNSVVTVTDSAISGSAWSENKGYINFAPAQGGVFNDGTGNLSGSAWGEQLGYIDFDGVSINGSTGKFSGTATGTLVGIITFDCTFCDVETDWRQTVVPPASVGSGGSSGSRRVSTPTFTLILPTIIPTLPSLGTEDSKQIEMIDDVGNKNTLALTPQEIQTVSVEEAVSEGTFTQPLPDLPQGEQNLFDVNLTPVQKITNLPVPFFLLFIFVITLGIIFIKLRR